MDTIAVGDELDKDRWIMVIALFGYIGNWVRYKSMGYQILFNGIIRSIDMILMC